MADGVGFEPTVRFHARWFSRPVPSTTRPPILHQGGQCLPFSWAAVKQMKMEFLPGPVAACGGCRRGRAYKPGPCLIGLEKLNQAMLDHVYETDGGNGATCNDAQCAAD